MYVSGPKRYELLTFVMESLGKGIRYAISTRAARFSILSNNVVLCCEIRINITELIIGKM